MLLYVLLASWSDTSNSPETQATAVFGRLFSRVFGRVFGKAISASTRMRTRDPNETPNRSGSTRARRFAPARLRQTPPRVRHRRLLHPPRRRELRTRRWRWRRLVPRQCARHAAPVMRAPARQVALRHAERLLWATQGVSSLASRGTGVMRISIPSLAAVALIVAGCGGAPTGAGAGSGRASDGGGVGDDAGAGSGNPDAGSGADDGGSDSGSDASSGSGGPATHMLSVEISGTGGASGSMQSTPAGIACRPSCSASFADGTDVVLTATAASGSMFKAWKGTTCSGSTTTCTVHLTGDAQVTAEFQPTTTQDECAGLAPGDPGEPVRLQATDFGNSCDIATSDGSGNMAATITDIFAAPPRDITNVRLFDGSGVSLGRFGYGSGPLFEQLAGFVGTSRPFHSSNSDVFAIDAHGNEIGRDSPGGV